MMKQVEKE